MPVFNYHCEQCVADVRRILTPTAARDPQFCDSCGSELDRNSQGPSTQVMERLDNGCMPKRVERLADAERLYRERSKIRP